jgi:membrane-associated phospholipid phosphatase
VASFSGETPISSVSLHSPRPNGHLGAVLATERPGVQVDATGYSWRSELWRRMRSLFVLKAVGTTAVTWLFFLAYFHLLRHPIHPVTVMPLTAIDRWIPFHPPMLIAYFSLWFYVGVAPGFLWSFKELFVYGLWAVALCCCGLAFFYFWPTAVPALMRTASDFPGFELLEGIDAAGNACPSMHVAIAMFTALCLHDLLRHLRVPQGLRLLNVIWFVAIAYSTLAVKQHVVIDVLAGGLLGAVFAAAALRWRPRPASLVTSTPPL